MTRQMLNLCIPMKPFTPGDKPGVKGLIGMHRFNTCLVGVFSVSCSSVKTPLLRIHKFISGPVLVDQKWLFWL